MNAPTYQGQPQGYGPPAPQGQPLGSPVQQAGEDSSGFFSGASGSPPLGFPKGEIGVWKGGIFTGQISTKQATTMRTETKPSEPRFWDSGDPVQDVVVEVLSPDRDTNNPLDDGRRRVFVTQENTHIPDSKASVTKDATRNGFHRGGQIYWCRTGHRMGKQNMRDVWECRYTPPTAETLAILDRMPPQGVSQQGADSVANNYQQQAQNGAPQTPFVGQQGSPPNQGQPQYGSPPGQQPGYNQGPSPQQQPQYVPPQYQQPAAQQGYGPPEQGPPGTAWNGQQGQVPPMGPQHGMYGPNGGPPPQGQPQYGQQPQQGDPSAQQAPPQYQQGPPHQTANPYAQYQQ